MSETVPRHRFLAGCGSALAAAAVAARADASALAALRRDPSAVRTMRVYALDPSITTLIGVSPAVLESFHGVRVWTHTDAASIRSMLDALAASAPKTGSAPADVRYGVVFLDRSNHRLLAAYADRFGTRGVIDGTRVAYDHPAPLLAALKKAAPVAAAQKREP